MIKMVSSFRWWDKTIMRLTRPSVLRAKLYNKIMDSQKVVDGTGLTVGEWLGKYDGHVLERCD